MPVTIQPATLKYKNGQGVFQSADCIKGDQGIPGNPTELIDDTSTTDTDKVWSAKKINDECFDLSQAINQKYTKPQTGIPASDLASGVIPAVPVTDVQVNGVSVLSQGVADVPIADASTLGVIKPSYGVAVDANGNLTTNKAVSNIIKQGGNGYNPIVSDNIHTAIYYGLARLAGASMASLSGETVGVYPEAQKSAISDMLNAPETVSGTTPTITAKSGVRYVCGEVSTLTIALPSSGDVEVIFESGSTATVLTVTPPSGVTAVKWAGSFDPTSLDANTVYDMIITDGKYGMVATWT